MTQRDFRSSMQNIRDELAGDGVVLAMCVIGGALLCIPFFGFLPLVSVCMGLTAVLATHKLLAEKVAELEKEKNESVVD